jgi:hypothetical protein
MNGFRQQFLFANLPYEIISNLARLGMEAG